MRGPHKNLGSFERSLRIFPYYIPMKYETTQLSQTISVGGCGTVKERSRAVQITAAKTPPIICRRRFSNEKVGNRKN